MTASNPLMSAPKNVGEAAKALRPVIAWALLGYVALHLFFAFLNWAAPDGMTLASRSYAASGGFLNLWLMAMPVLAVLIATQISPALSSSKLIAAIALIEYAVAIVLGGLSFLIGFGSLRGVDDMNQAVDLLRHFVMTTATIGLIGLAGFLTLRVFLALGGKLPNLSSPKAD